MKLPPQLLFLSTIVKRPKIGIGTSDDGGADPPPPKHSAK